MVFNILQNPVNMPNFYAKYAKKLDICKRYPKKTRNRPFSHIPAEKSSSKIFRSEIGS